MAAVTLARSLGYLRQSRSDGEGTARTPKVCHRVPKHPAEGDGLRREEEIEPRNTRKGTEEDWTTNLTNQHESKDHKMKGHLQVFS